MTGNRIKKISPESLILSDKLILGLIAVGFLIRAAMGANRFDTDDALFYLILNNPRVIDVYRATLGINHPPLMYLLLHFWRHIGNSEWILHLPGVIAGTLSLWTGFKWLDITFGRTIGLLGLAMMAFSPTIVLISATLRDYSFLVLFLFSALYFFEYALQHRSGSALFLFFVFLTLGSLTDYSAFWFTIALGICGSVMITAIKPAKRFIWEWVAGWGGLATIWTILYITHISAVIRGELNDDVNGWARRFFFHPGQEGQLRFIIMHTVAAFHYLFRFDPLQIAVPSIFLIGAISLAAGFQPDRPVPRRDLGYFILLSFVIGISAALFQFYPYGDTRHVLYLLPCAVAGFSAGIIRLTGKRSWLLPAILGFFVFWWSKELIRWEIANIRMERLAKASLEYIIKTTPKGGLIFTDTDMNQELGYYFARDEAPYTPTPINGIAVFPYGGYRIATNWPISLYDYSPDAFIRDIAAVARTFHLHRGDRCRVLASTEGNLLNQLQQRYPEMVLPGAKNFGFIDTFEVSIQ